MFAFTGTPFGFPLVSPFTFTGIRRIASFRFVRSLKSF